MSFFGFNIAHTLESMYGNKTAADHTLDSTVAHASKYGIQMYGSYHQGDVGLSHTAYQTYPLGCTVTGDLLCEITNDSLDVNVTFPASQTVDGSVTVSGTVAVSSVGGSVTVSNAALTSIDAKLSGTGTVNVKNTAATVLYVTNLPGVSGSSANFKQAANSTSLQVLKNTAGTFDAIRLEALSSGTLAYLHVWDRATLPTLGVNPSNWVFAMPTNGNPFRTEVVNLAFSNGLVVALLSSGAPTASGVVSILNSNLFDVTVKYT